WPDGSLHWLLGKGRPYYDEKGKPVRMRGTVLEITERKQFEDSLKRSNESIRNERAWYEMVLNSVPTPVILLDSESRSIFFKNDATKNLQVTIPTVLPESGTHAFRAYDTNGEIIPPEQMPRHRVLRGEVLRDFELCWETSTSTSHFIIDGTLLPAAFGHRAFGILSFRDISPIKRLEKERIQSEHELRQFMNTLSHDLKNPLSASRMTAQMIARHPDHLDRIPSLASRIIDSLSRADKMIDDLLDASRIRAGKGLPIEIEECDLTQIANSVCEEMISVHGDRFRRELPDSLIGFWSCKNIYRLIENLLSNGIKYGFHDTPVTLKISAHESMIEISVHNLGEPISPDDQKQLFDPFVRSKAVESSHRKGWGLGLTLVRGVAEAHRGRVDVQSDKKRGTTFRVTLPRDARTKT
ncbi:MAG: ATP-binding protein, partial [Bdellovibrionia bacterium]